MSIAFDVVHPARPGDRALTAEDIWRVPRPGRPVPAADGRSVAVPVTTYDLETDRGQSRIHRLAADGASDRILTSAERHATEPAFSPDGTRLAFVSRPIADKEAPAQLHVMPVDGGEARCLTDLPLGVFDPRWLPDGSGLVFGGWLFDGHLTPEATRAEQARRKEQPIKVHRTEARLFRFWDRWLTDGKVPHLFRLDLDGEEPIDLMPDATLWFSWMEPAGAYDIAPDGRTIAFAGLSVGGPEHRLRTDVYVIHADAASVPECLTADNPAGSFRPRFAPDGTRLLYGKTEDRDFYADRIRLMAIDLEARRHDPVLADWDRSPADWTFAADGTLWFHAEDDARTAIFRLDAGAAAPVEVIGGGTNGAPQPTADDALVFLRQDLAHPPEVWRAGTDGKALRRLTAFGDEALEGVALGEVRDMRFEGADGDTVQMFVVLPPDHDPGTPLPLVHMIHGGPHGTFGDTWHPRWNAQAFAAPGYVAALVNFHGSTSWGQRFAQCIQGAWGDFPRTDMHAATDVLIAAGLVDETRMAISGGSYGGYLTSWLASTSDRFACAINHAGVYDLALQYASDVTWGRPRNMGAQIWDDPVQVDRWNPGRHADGLNTPMLVIHGEKDYRVPINHAIECYGILQARGIPARLVYFEDENHWVLKPRNSLLWYEEVHAWLARFLGDAA